MIGPLRRLGAALLALLLVYAGGPGPASARPSRVDREVKKVSRRAEQLLNTLEYERGRELLEASVRKKRYASASNKRKGELWALLGRARAELGDEVGADMAFVEAVRWDRDVTLSRSTSPKIRAALDRARRNAPPPYDPPPPPPPPPPRTAQKARRAPPPPRAPRGRGAWLEHAVRGSTTPGSTVTLEVRHGGLSKRARIEAKVRRRQGGPFETIRMTRTGTIATAPLRLDVPRLEVYVVARRGRRVLARDGSEAAPFAIVPRSTAPTVAEAWSEASPPAGPTPTETSSAGLALGPPPAPPPPAPPPGGATYTSELGTTEIVLLSVGGAVVVASVVTAVLLLATRTPRCEVEEGQGCVEVQVTPASLVRF